MSLVLFPHPKPMNVFEILQNIDILWSFREYSSSSFLCKVAFVAKFWQELFRQSTRAFEPNMSLS